MHQIARPESHRFGSAKDISKRWPGLHGDCGGCADVGANLTTDAGLRRKGQTVTRLLFLNKLQRLGGTGARTHAAGGAFIGNSQRGEAQASGEQLTIPSLWGWQVSHRIQHPLALARWTTSGCFTILGHGARDHHLTSPGGQTEQIAP